MYRFEVYQLLLDPTPVKIKEAMLLVERLQADSHKSLYRCIDIDDNPAAYGWTKDSQLSAAQIDSINMGAVLNVRTAMNGNNKFPFMDPTPTPYDEKKEVVQAEKAKKPLSNVVEKAPVITHENTFSADDFAALMTK